MGLLVLACVVAAGGRSARAEARPAGVFVTLTPVTDHAERTDHADLIRARLGACAQLANRVVDVNVTRLAWVEVGATVELQLELSFVMSTTGNEIVSVANQTAKLVMSKSRFRIDRLPALRHEVIDDALGSLIAKLRRVSIRSV